MKWSNFAINGGIRRIVTPTVAAQNERSVVKQSRLSSTPVVATPSVPVSPISGYNLAVDHYLHPSSDTKEGPCLYYIEVTKTRQAPQQQVTGSDTATAANSEPITDDCVEPVSLFSGSFLTPILPPVTLIFPEPKMHHVRRKHSNHSAGLFPKRTPHPRGL